MTPGHMTPGHMSLAGHMTPGRITPGHMTPGRMSLAGHMTPGHMTRGDVVFSHFLSQSALLLQIFTIYTPVLEIKLNSNAKKEQTSHSGDTTSTIGSQTH